MTRHKDFKALVRARMRSTGQTYTAARASLLEERARLARQRNAEAAAADQRRIVARMFHAGRLRTIPAKRKLRAAVLLEVLTRFEPARTYPESEVSLLLAEVHEDFAHLRRELVSFGYLQRSGGRYWVCAEPPDRTERQRDELPGWEATWLPGFVSGAAAATVVA